MLCRNLPTIRRVRRAGIASAVLRSCLNTARRRSRRSGGGTPRAPPRQDRDDIHPPAEGRQSPDPSRRARDFGGSAGGGGLPRGGPRGGKRKGRAFRVLGSVRIRGVLKAP